MREESAVEKAVRGEGEGGGGSGRADEEGVAMELVAAVRQLLIWAVLSRKAERKDSQRSGEEGRCVSGC